MNKEKKMNKSQDINPMLFNSIQSSNALRSDGKSKNTAQFGA